MAKKRKYSSKKDGMMFKQDRRGNTIGEHHGRNVAGDYFSKEHSPEGPRGFEPSGGSGETFEERMNLNKRMRIMQTNNGNMGPIKEDFSKPCGIPYGAISKDLGIGDYYSMNGYRVGDLYEQVDKTSRQDAAALKSQTKPTNW